MPQITADAFRAARRDRGLVVLEGFHALKHALRFGADVERIVAAGSADLEQLSQELAPDVADRLRAADRVDDAALASFVPRVPRTGVIALARRPAFDVAAVLEAGGPEPIVLLEEPRTMGNLGACVRVAAAAGIGGVLTTGPHDPWHPDAVRGGAGLQFALPVGRIPGEGSSEQLATAVHAARAAGRPIVALDPAGDPLDPGRLPMRAVLAFGTERDGLTGALLAAADARAALPMRDGVSSLNLATSVAATLYAWRFGV